MLRLYLDEDLADDLGSLLRLSGHDAAHTREMGNMGFKDARQLAFAAGAGRVMVTANVADFRLLHEGWLLCSPLIAAEQARPHPGILIVPNPNAMTAPVMASVVDALSRSTNRDDLLNRLLRWRKDLAAWEDLSTPR